MKKIYLIIVLVFPFLFVKSSFSQWNLPINPEDSSKLFFAVENINFFKNNEYFNNIKEGYTLIGYFVTPTITYYPSPKTKLNAGIHLLKYSGLDQFSEVLPVFTLQQKLSKNIDIVLGSIYGTNNHQLIEPLFKYERYFNNNIENGIQFLFDYKHFQSDIWLNWENFILPNDTLQEEFTVGTSSNFMLTNTENNFQFYVPLQTIVTHKGGQINNNNDYMQTLTNFSVGFCMKFKFPHSFLKSISLDNYVVGYKDLSPTKLQHFNEGYGVYPNFVFETTNFKLSHGFWYASKFIAPRGEELFQSVSYSDTTYTEKMRRLFTTKLVYNKLLFKGVSMNVSLESYYDQRNKNLDYSYGLYLRFSSDFFINKFDH